MKLKIVLLILVLLLLIPQVVPDRFTDRIYCKISGDCELNSLTVQNDTALLYDILVNDTTKRVSLKLILQDDLD